MNELLNGDLIDCNLKSRDGRVAAEALAELLLKNGRVSDKAAFLKDVWEREAVSSTDTGIGVAIPHGRSQAVIQTSVAIGRHPEGIFWDDETVQAVVLLAVKDDPEGLTHLELISEISTMLMDDDFLEVLFHAEKDDLLNEIDRRLKEAK